MRFIFIALSFLFATQIRAAVLSDMPYLYKVYGVQPGESAGCQGNFSSVFAGASKDLGLVPGGWPFPAVLAEENECQVTGILAGREAISAEQIKARFAEHGFPVRYVVDTTTGTFMGFTALVNFKNGLFDYCQRNREEMKAFAHWGEGYRALRAELEPVKVLSREEKISWIAERFRCPGLESAESVDIVMDVANQAECPLTPATVGSCFVLRGLEKTNLVLTAN